MRARLGARRPCKPDSSDSLDAVRGKGTSLCWVLGVGGEGGRLSLKALPCSASSAALLLLLPQFRHLVTGAGGWWLRAEERPGVIEGAHAHAGTGDGLT